MVILFNGAKRFSNFGRGSPKEHFCAIILKSDHWPWSRCCLKFFVVFFSIFSSGGHFVQPSGTILAHLVEGYPRNISVKLYKNWSIGLGEDIIKRFF